MKAFLVGLTVLVVAACSSLDLTPKQQLFDAINKYEAVQIIVEEVIADPDISDSVKQPIFTANEIAFEAMLHYRAAVESGLTTQALIREAGSAVIKLVQILIEHGFIERDFLALKVDGGSAGIQLAKPIQGDYIGVAA